MKERFIHIILRHLAPRLILLLGSSMRFRWVNDKFVREMASRGKNCIFCFWHNRFLLMPHVYNHFRGKKNICVMASMSRDGEFIADALKGLGYEVARGSSSRGGEGAVMEMCEMLSRGLDAAVTPDGPRGPLYKVRPGVVMLSQMSGVPIIPASYDVRRKKRLNSWDRFIIPKPFSSAALVFGDPVYVPTNADDDDRKEIRRRLEQTMKELNSRAAELLGVDGD